MRRTLSASPWRVLPGSLLLGPVLLLASACADTGPLEVRYELTGEPGVTVGPVIVVPAEGGDGTATQRTTQETGPVPWQATLVVERGETTLEATPSRGALTCRIVVEGREAARVTGVPGQPVTCSAPVGE
ncbi:MULTISPECIES: hypothetical protein [Micromonospora]|uniref:Uncharacterized protein n=1 Tax=Micromonospora haikouensis TaxID=686309 RepID=A0A0D0VIQ7_9ACTN|nr:MULTISPECIES: hypothetical protein [Micromonospora]KIR60653.1 hypothetical protein TK50_22415 [Micromonospora haikouensis]